MKTAGKPEELVTFATAYGTVRLMVGDRLLLELFPENAGKLAANLIEAKEAAEEVKEKHQAFVE